MKLTKNSEIITKSLKTINKKLLTFINPIENNKLLKNIFKHIHNAQTSKNKYLYEELDKPETHKSNSNIPSIIRNEIDEKFNIIYRCNINLEKYKFNVLLYFDSKQPKKRIQEIIHYIYTAIYIISKFSILIPSIHNIEIYFTKSEKQMPNKNNVLSEEHVNSAFVFSCITNRQLCIYREEEWLKTLIHETFHRKTQIFITEIIRK